MAIGPALTKLMHLKRVTQQQVADQVGVTRQSVSRWCKDLSDPTTEKLNELSQYFGVPINDFFLDADRVQTCVPAEEEPPADTIAIPEFEFRVAAGDNYENDWEELHSHHARWYSADFFRNRHLDPKRCIRCTVHGDSMVPTIQNGDKILFYLEQDFTLQRVRDGSIYVLSVNGALKVKRLSIQKDSLVVTSDNTEYPKEIYSGEELNDVRIYGRVIEVTRSL